MVIIDYTNIYTPDIHIYTLKNKYKAMKIANPNITYQGPFTSSHFSSKLLYFSIQHDLH